MGIIDHYEAAMKIQDELNWIAHTKIRKFNDPVLKQVATECVPQTDPVRPIVAAMIGALDASPIEGIGLAAPQIGVSKRIIVIKIGGRWEAIINPEITWHTKKKVGGTEECLSYPGVRRRVARYSSIVVHGFNEQWQPVKFKLKKMTARCAQHEIDHLNGVTIG